MSQPPPLPRSSEYIGRILAGIIVANLVGGIVCAFGYWIGRAANPGNEIIVPSLLLVPVAMGMVAAWIWKPLRLGMGAALLHSLFCTVFTIFVAALVFREGVICVIILSPLLYASIAAGALLGRIWFRTDRLNLLIAPALVFAVVGELSLRGSHHSVVVDEVRIAAPPSAVWPHVLAFDRIPAAPDYWLFHLGLPYPTSTTNAGNFAGAARACEFSGGAVFDETIVEFAPERKLTFDIIKMPPDPELMGHLDAHRGQFELRDNGDGTTTLVGRTWYSLHVRPAAYFDWWTHQIFRAVHLRVMNNVKRLAEAAP